MRAPDEAIRGTKKCVRVHWLELGQHWLLPAASGVGVLRLGVAGKVQAYPRFVSEQFKATLQYNVSKRTALYTTASLLRNKDATALTLPGAAGSTTPGDDSKGFEIGLRHFF